MGQYSNLKAIASKLLKLGKTGVTLNGEAASVDRNFYLPDSDVDLRAGLEGQILGQIGANSVGWFDNYSEALVTRAFNDTGSTINKGQVVYFNTRQGDRPKAYLAQANTLANCEKTVGLAYETVGTGLDVRVVENGLLKAINTDVVGWTEGDVLYLSDSTPGGITNVAPTGNSHAIEIGILVRKHVNQGVILVRVNERFKLERLQNVSLSSPTNGQVLTYDSALNAWKNAAGGGGGGASGYTEIPAGGNITGTYEGTVYCAGNATFTGNVTVRGSLYVIGNLLNTQGYSLTVKGDCIVDGYIDFTAASGVTQGAVDVGGDLIIRGERSIGSVVPLVGAGLDPAYVETSTGYSGSIGYDLTVTSAIDEQGFSVQDGRLTPVSNLSNILKIGDYIEYAGEEREIVFITDTGFGTADITVFPAFSSIPMGTVIGGTRTVFTSFQEPFSDSLFASSNLMQTGDTVEFPFLSESKTINYFQQISDALGSNYGIVVRLDSNLSSYTPGFTSFNYLPNQLLKFSGSFPSWVYGFNEISIVYGTGAVGESATITAFLKMFQTGALPTLYYCLLKIQPDDMTQSYHWLTQSRIDWVKAKLETRLGSGMVNYLISLP